MIKYLIIIILSMILSIITLCNAYNIPENYYMELLSNDGDITKILHQDDKSIVNNNDISYNLNICTPGNETILKYNNTKCQVTCLYGKYSDGNLCGSCSSYNPFYWISISKEVGKCNNGNSLGLLYKYVIDTGIYVEYCIDNNRPIYIKIERPDKIIYKKVTTWRDDKKDITIPEICSK